MFFACRIWCIADVSSVSPSSEQKNIISNLTTHMLAGLFIVIFNFSDFYKAFHFYFSFCQN